MVALDIVMGIMTTMVMVVDAKKGGNEVTNDTDKEDSKITELQKEINELKNIIRKANQMVPQPMKEMLPQDMKDAMNKVGQ